MAHPIPMADQELVSNHLTVNIRARQSNMDFPSIYIFTDAGKPVYVRSDQQEEQETSRMCSFLSSLFASIVHRNLGLGVMKALSSDSLKISVLTVDALIFVAVSRTKKNEAIDLETNLFQRLILEHLYLNLLNTLTSHALTLIDQNPSFELRTLIGNDDISCELFRSGEPFIYTGSFLTGGVETFFPLSPHVRDAASLILKKLCSDNPNYVFALILADDKLVTIVQPPQRQNHIRNFDLLHFTMFLRRQSNILTDELWLPFCFPRFDAAGFLHCYTNCLDVATRTVLILVSQDPTSFLKCRSDAAAKIRPKFGLPAFGKESLLEILEDRGLVQDEDQNRRDVTWRRTCVDDALDDSDYEWVPYDYEEQSMALLREIKATKDCSKSELLLKDIMNSAGIHHFVFRLDVPVASSTESRRDLTHLTFSLNSPTLPSAALSTSLLWSTYRKLSMRLRSGSAASESGFEGTSAEGESPFFMKTATDYSTKFPNICPAMQFLEEPPAAQGICHVSDAKMTYLAMNGQGFETFEL